MSQSSAAETAMAEMDAMFDRWSTARRWDRLTVEAKERICRAAVLSDEGRFLKLEQFEIGQQEAIRLALRDLMPALREYGGTALDRREWYRTNRASIPQRAQVAPTNAPLESASRDDLLASRNALMKKINGPVGQHPEPQALYDEE